MVSVNDIVAGAAQVLVRVVELQARQVSSSVSSTIATTSATPTPSTTSGLSTTVSSTSASVSPTDSSLPGGNNNNNNNNNTQTGTSPLLFFVALGFGVVFTNLWIIVGVKYCFRYNARNRQMRLAGEDGEPITLDNMPRPHRRRREKKLMTMDEVNEKFPMMKYKSWVAGRLQQGLPAQGGVSAPASRASSVAEAEGIVPEVSTLEHEGADARPSTSSNEKAAAVEKDKPSDSAEEGTSSSEAADAATRPNLPTVASRSSSQEDDDDDEHINAALPPECMGSSGDTCAICIDTLEDDDDVRGLTCGHAFHAVCVDPWLTSRRACCPLCKADYYVPKPRPAPAEGADAAQGGTGQATVADGQTNRMNMPTRPQQSFLTLGGRNRMMFPSRFYITSQGGVTERRDESSGPRFFHRLRAQRQQAEPTASGAVAVPATETAAGSSPEIQTDPSSGGRLANLRSAMPRRPFSRFRRQAAAAPTGESETAAPTVSPSQLEAGVRPAAS